MELIFRLIFFFILLMAFIISGTYRRRARQSGDVIARQDEGIAIFILRMALALPLLATMLLYVGYPPAIAWLQFAIPGWMRMAAAGAGALTLPLIIWVFRSIGRNISETVLTKSDHQLVTSGPYRWVRHPLYASALLLLFSLGLLASSWFLLLYSLLTLVLFRTLVIPEEERQLIKAFGEPYREYQRRSGALLPRILSDETRLIL